MFELVFSQLSSVGQWRMSLSKGNVHNMSVTLPLLSQIPKSKYYFWETATAFWGKSLQ